MYRTIASILICSMFAAGCAHTTANPVPIAQVGDDTKTCEAIANEIQQMVNTKTAAEGDRNAQVGTNVALGVAGVFLIVPWFFMDTGNAHSVEAQAAQARYLRLQQMQADRRCPAVPEQVAIGPDGKPIASQTKADGATVPVKVVAAEALTPAQKLEYLDAMMKKGLITQVEYDAKKAEILRSM
jgi:cytochrome c1